MGRIYSGKPVRDTETAAESIINSTLTSNTIKKINEMAIHMTVTAQFQSSQQIDEFYEKKSKE